MSLTRLRACAERNDTHVSASVVGGDTRVATAPDRQQDQCPTHPQSHRWRRRQRRPRPRRSVQQFGSPPKRRALRRPEHLGPEPQREKLAMRPLRLRTRCDTSRCNPSACWDGCCVDIDLGLSAAGEWRQFQRDVCSSTHSESRAANCPTLRACSAVPVAYLAYIRAGESPDIVKTFEPKKARSQSAHSRLAVVAARLS
jgi:hypothetical protein